MLKKLLVGIVALLFVFVLGIAFFVWVTQPVPEEDALELSVLDAESQNFLSGAHVRVLDENSQVVFEKSTGRKGTASLDVEPGVYYINASLEGYEPSQKRITVSEGQSKSFNIELNKIVVQCDEDWNCTEWSECVEGVKARICVDLNSCGSEEEKPNEQEFCEVVKKNFTCVSDSECNDFIDCTINSCVNGSCVAENITECVEGDYCCPSGCTAAEDPECGTVVEGDECEAVEDCDIQAGQCMEADCVNGFCVEVTVVDCVDDDGCCPLGCSFSKDNDCTEEDECKSNSDCNDNNPCTDDLCSGNPKTCSNDEITTCSGSDRDSCCPSNCDYYSDKDCNLCENDGDCDDDDECTIDLCHGSPQTCSNQAIITCEDDDGCCPTGCNQGNDNDCSNECTYAYDCNDQDPCTEDSCDGTNCVYDEITTCNEFEPDGCCPDSCTPSTDADCQDINYCESDAECEDYDDCTVTDFCNLGTNRCEHTFVSCGPDDGCCPPNCGGNEDKNCRP